jgi:hypothetical protein
MNPFGAAPGVPQVTPTALAQAAQALGMMPQVATSLPSVPQPNTDFFSERQLIAATELQKQIAEQQLQVQQQLQQQLQLPGGSAAHATAAGATAAGASAAGASTSGRTAEASAEQMAAMYPDGYQPPTEGDHQRQPMAEHGYTREPGDTALVDVKRVDAMLMERVDAKRTRDFDTADRIRDELREMGVEIYDRERTWRSRYARRAPPPVARVDPATVTALPTALCCRSGGSDTTATSLPRGWWSGTDPATRQTYYMNTETGISQWEPPPPPPPPPIPLPPGWVEQGDAESGEVYYGQPETGHTQWERPGVRKPVEETIDPHIPTTVPPPPGPPPALATLLLQATAPLPAAVSAAAAPFAPAALPQPVSAGSSAAAPVSAAPPARLPTSLLG